MQQLTLDGTSVPLPKFTVGMEKIIRLDSTDPRYDDYSSMECVIVAVFLVQSHVQCIERQEGSQIVRLRVSPEYRYQIHIPEYKEWDDEEDIVVREDELV